MWLTSYIHHKILDTEKISKKCLFSRKKSVDKSPLGLVYYSSTHPEEAQFSRGFEISQKISEKGLTMREWRVRIPKFADEPV